MRVCRTCYSSGNDFRRALLGASFRDVMGAYNRGCVNLRAPCSLGKEVGERARPKQFLNSISTSFCLFFFSGRQIRHFCVMSTFFCSRVHGGAVEACRQRWARATPRAIPVEAASSKRPRLKPVPVHFVRTGSPSCCHGRRPAACRSVG